MVSRGDLCRALQWSGRLGFTDLQALLESLVDFPALLPKQQRDGFFPLVTVLCMWLAQLLRGRGSCQSVVGTLVVAFEAMGLLAPSRNTSAYCQARNKLPQAALDAIAERLATTCHSIATAHWLWHGFPVKVADGTTINVADTEQNAQRFGYPSNQKAGCGFPQARLVALFCLATGAMVGYALGSYLTSERMLFHQLLVNFWDQKDLLLGDRLFCAYADFCERMARGAHLVVRQHQTLSTGICEVVKELGHGDRLLQWRRARKPSRGYDETTWKQLPETILVRQIEVYETTPGFRTQHYWILTTLTEQTNIKAEDFAALYRRRWQVELCLRHIKTTMGMEHLRCKTPQMVHKEVAVHFIVYNLVRALMAKAAINAKTTVDLLSFKASMSAACDWAHHLDLKLPARIEQMYQSIGRCTLKQRLNRIEPRKLKKRQSKFTHLTTTRKELRALALQTTAPDA